MLRVTVELVPFGYEDRKRTLETMEIWNDGVFPDDQGNYKYGFKLQNIEPFIKDGRANHDKESYSGEIWGQDRKKNVWSLVRAILTEIRRLK